MSGPNLKRRTLMGFGLGLLVQGAVTTSVAAAIVRPSRVLSFRHLHTGERLSLAYRAGDGYNREALARIDHLMRDFRSGDIHPIAPQLLDLLADLQHSLGSKSEIEVISGYRSPETNATLAKRSNGVAKRSLHMRGLAVDIRLPDQNLETVYKTAREMRAGGVGLYRRSRFVHLDVGRPRFW